MIEPGQTVGILGGGQLGRFLGIEARLLGLKTVVLDPTPDSPAAQVCDRHVRAPVDDEAAALELARACDVVTLEWELIPAGLLEAIEKLKPLFPSARVIRSIQDRLTQKRFLEEHGFPQTPFAAVSKEAELRDAVRKIGFPCILKRRTHGYDGKGQVRLKTQSDLASAAAVLPSPCVLEAHVSYIKEVSAIQAISRSGECRAYPLAENVHENGILRSTVAPARASAAEASAALELARRVGRALGHVGVMAVEMFLLPGGKLLVNEIAPRVHNSGHYTLGACATSQFEQHLRAVGGLPLGSTELRSPVAMLNLLGDLWSAGEPDWNSLLRRPGVQLFLYGKAKPAPGRKMGHFLVLGPDADGALARANDLFQHLSRSPVVRPH